MFVLLLQESCVFFVFQLFQRKLFGAKDCIRIVFIATGVDRGRNTQTYTPPE